MSTITADGKTKWVSARTAREILGVGDVGVRKLVDLGAVGVREYPGSPPKYSREDLERAARSYTRPARENASA